MNTPWWASPMVCFDTETTGIDVTTDRIVTATIVHVGPDGATPTGWLLDPGVDIPDGATAVHGITTEHARTHGRPPAEVLPEIAAHLRAAWDADVPVVAFNATYDVSILDRELRRHGLPGFTPDTARPVIDPAVLDKAVDRYRKGGRKLGDVCTHYGVRLDAAHDATQDALAAGRLAWQMPRRLPGLQALTLRELHDAQVWWRRQQADGLAAFWAAKGDPRADSVDGSWPLQVADGEPQPVMPPEPAHEARCRQIGRPEKRCSCPGGEA